MSLYKRRTNIQQSSMTQQARRRQSTEVCPKSTENTRPMMFMMNVERPLTVEFAELSPLARNTTSASTIKSRTSRWSTATLENHVVEQRRGEVPQYGGYEKDI